MNFFSLVSKTTPDDVSECIDGDFCCHFNSKLFNEFRVFDDPSVADKSRRNRLKLGDLKSQSESMQDDSCFSEFRCGPPTGAWARGSMGRSAGMPLRRRHAGEKLEMTAGLRMAGRVLLLPCRAHVGRQRARMAGAERVDVQAATARVACVHRKLDGAAAGQMSMKMRSTHCSWNSLWLRKLTRYCSRPSWSICAPL